VAIHPGAGGPLRQWKPQRFGRIARRLATDLGAAVLLIGGPGDKGLVDQVVGHMEVSPAFQSTGLSLLETAALIRRCDLFIGNDSAPAHMAAAVGTAGLTLFGPTWPHMWRPLSPAGRVLYKEVPCRACRQERCLRPEQSCMDMIGVEEVWQTVKEMLLAKKV
jgi:ADP-heptose:LPS heptosyltransferase